MVVAREPLLDSRNAFAQGGEEGSLAEKEYTDSHRGGCGPIHSEVHIETWYLIIGLLLVGISLLGSIVRRLPLTTTILYFGVGLILGPLGFHLYAIDPLANSKLLELVTEISVIVSLFTAGLKLRLPLRDKLWRVPIRLASVSMMLTVGLITAAGVFLLGLPVGAAVLLGAILAPTDPVLASDVQLESAEDRDRLRFGLTGEAGLNDGTAFPFVLLGVGLLGLHELGSWGWRWLVADVLWATCAGLAIGFALGALTAKFVLYLRREHKEGVGRDESLVLGLIALSYGAALHLHAYGFLAVFAAGLALRSIERQHTGDESSPNSLPSAGAGTLEEIATDREKAPAHMAQSVLAFNEQIERVLEVALVLIVAGSITSAHLNITALWFVALLFLIIRPLAVFLGLLGRDVGKSQLKMMGWFGIRGIGSVYYLMFAINQGLPSEIASQLIALTLSAIAVSILVHGFSVTPLMGWYARRAQKRAS
jgi:NhaP-type Na+/H+ or K+/H+ antiporter